VPGVTTEVWVPEIANHVPHLRIRWDPQRVKISVPEVVKRLREGEPSIEVVPGSRDQLVVGVWMMEPGEDRIVGRRIREILRSAV
jgi:L-seryl-tRNA(Ser) seleniumtransferase